MCAERKNQPKLCSCLLAESFISGRCASNEAHRGLKLNSPTYVVGDKIQGIKNYRYIMIISN